MAHLSQMPLRVGDRIHRESWLNSSDHWELRRPILSSKGTILGYMAILHCDRVLGSPNGLEWPFTLSNREKENDWKLWEKP